MKVLDLCCKAGGAGHGFYLAGSEVFGVDIEPQPNYPFEFRKDDAIALLHLMLDNPRTKHQFGNTLLSLNDFDYIHASPPCQAHSAMTKGRWQDRLIEHPQLIEPMRKLLIESGKPYDIENVQGAPLINPVMLCGTMFNLTTKHGSQLRRHRLFETNWNVGLVPPCNHNKASAIGVYGGGQHPSRRKVPATIGVWGHAGGSSNRDNLLQFGTQDRRDAMGIQWMTGSELSQAIPPAYTKFLMERFLSL